jgi:hypothetical protein
VSNHRGYGSAERSGGGGISSEPGEVACDEDTLAAMRPHEAGGEGEAAGADADAASGGVVGGIRAMGKHLARRTTRGRASVRRKRRAETRRSGRRPPSKP